MKQKNLLYILNGGVWFEKKYYYNLLIILLTSMIVISCDSNVLNREIDFSQEKIVRAELSNKEESFLKALTDRYFVFDVLKINKEYKRLDIWVDCYENGELKNKGLSMEVSLEEIENNYNRILLATQSSNHSSKNEIWTLSTLAEKGATSGRTTFDMPENLRMSGWSTIDSVDIVEEGAINLAAVIIATRDSIGDKGSIRLSSKLLEDEETLQETIQKYDYVYILRCSFSKESL